MLKLLEKFMQLDVQKRGALTNKEFLDLPELRYSPFRPRLIDAFPLKVDNDVQTLKAMRDDHVISVTTFLIEVSGRCNWRHLKVTVKETPRRKT